MFDLDGREAYILSFGTESFDSHRYIDQFFPCENCAFSPLAEEQQALAGVWVIDAVELDKPANPHQWHGGRWTVQGDEISGVLPTEQPAEQVFQFKILELGGKIRKIDLQLADKPDPIAAVYFRDRDSLVVCWTPGKNARPGKFYPRVNGDIVIRFRRG
jgi:uncharacterized protein (TIGR03067 family)